MLGEFSPKNSEGWERFQKGLSLDAMGKTEEAVEVYREALVYSPEMAEIHFNLGMDLALLGKKEEAIRAWRRAIWLNRDYQTQLISAFDLEHELREALIEPITEENEKNPNAA